MSKKTKKIITISILGSIILLAFFGFIHCSKSTKIDDFDPQRDTAGILKNFNEDWYWLVAEEVKLDVSYLLETRSPNDFEPQYHGKLIIKVIREHGQAVAFTTYHLLTPDVGRIQFVSVARSARGKGYGRALTDYAVHDLLSMGCKEVVLSTRTNNSKSRYIYEQYGFKITSMSDRFVYYSFKKP